MDPDFVAKAAQIASVLEVSGYPKPGNVHRTQDFEDMIFEDFLVSGIVIGDKIKEAAYKGKKYKNRPDEWHKIELGNIIKRSILETDKWVENNTNLGIIMLLTPLSAAAGMSDNFDQIRGNLELIMKSTTAFDAVNLYDAINIAQAGGMGETNELDVGSKQAKKELILKNINMYKVLEISSSWDMLAYELTNKMPVSFELGYPTFKHIKKAFGMNKATVQTYLTILSIYPDTLISRKFDRVSAEQVSADAKLILDKGGILTQEGISLLEEFDNELMDKKRNPGTTADLTASSIMLAILNQFEDYNNI